MNIRIVTDSTSDLPADIAADMGIAVIPQKIIFGAEELRDRVDITADEFYDRVSHMKTLPTTSQASVGEFVELYEDIGRDADAIVSVHVSSKLSGTLNSATQASEQANVNCDIRVIDSLSASMGTGLVAMAAAAKAREGASVDEVAKHAEQAVERTEIYVLLDTLEYLAKGGRIGNARAMIGSLLKVKPMIIIKDGVVDELGKERTHKRGVARLARVTNDFAPFEDVVIMHTTTPDEAREFGGQFQALLPQGKAPRIAQIGPAVGAYTGPHALGVALLRS